MALSRRTTIHRGDGEPSGRAWQTAGVDLDRIVWDPEYRAEVRALLGREGEADSDATRG